MHRTTSALMLVCLATAAMLYLPALAEIVGRRRLVVTVHEWAGIMLPVPALAGLASRAFRRDLKLLNRFADHDWSWLRDALRRRPRNCGCRASSTRARSCTHPSPPAPRW